MLTCSVCNQSNRPTAKFCAHCRAPLVLQQRYRLTRVLGRGGFGAVYLAEQAHLGGALCAVKELTPDPQATPQELQQAAAQFQFEARVLAQINHPALPKVTDFFLEGGRCYLVMEYVPGETLDELLARNRAPLPEAQVQTWMLALCDVLIYLHSLQPPIIHRDVKPANIKIMPNGQLKLIDFGIAKLLAAGVGTAGAARAVSAPFSPWEQYGRGKGTDARSDIYATGVTMYRLLTNQLPPEAPDRLHERTAPPRQYNPALSPGMEMVVLKAMAEKSDERFQHASEFKHALHTRNVSASSPQPAGAPYGSPAPLFPPQTRPRDSSALIALGVVGALLLGIVIIAGAFWGFSEMNRQAQVNATAFARATSTAYAEATVAAQAQATANVRATATVQANATATAQAEATATAQARALLSAQTNATATAFARATQTAQARATATPRPFVSTTSPFKDITFGRGGVDTKSTCRVTESASVSQLSLIDDEYFYFAMPFRASDLGKKLYWSLTGPDARAARDKVERELAADDELCFWQGISIDPIWTPGRYALEVTAGGEIVYRTSFTVEPADIVARRPKRDPFGRFTFGRSSIIESTCVVENTSDRVNQSELAKNKWFYFTSSFTPDEAGQLFYWTVYQPDGSTVFNRVEKTIRDGFWLCQWQGFSIGTTPARGRYRLVIEYKSRTVFDKYFYIE